MIEYIKVRNFKSMGELKLDLARVNILIGEPNSGKSNILESVGILSVLSSDPSRLRDFVRFERVVDLFHDQRTNDSISVGTDRKDQSISISFNNNKLWIDSANGYKFSYNMKGEFSGQEGKGPFEQFKGFKYYLFSKNMEFRGDDIERLIPPFGSNLPSLIHYNDTVKRMFSDLMEQYDYEPVIDPYEFKIKLLKRSKDLKVLLPYETISEGLRRQVFFNTAMLANRDSLITMEEPESSLFPYYVANFAETIGLSKDRNQYLISTHNNYFLRSIVEKTPATELKVHVVRMKEGRTVLESMTGKMVQGIFEEDPFLSIATRS